MSSQALADDNGWLFLNTSAMTGLHVPELFHGVAMVAVAGPAAAAAFFATLDTTGTKTVPRTLKGQDLSSKFPLVGEQLNMWRNWVDSVQEWLMRMTSENGYTFVKAWGAILKAWEASAAKVIANATKDLSAAERNAWIWKMRDSYPDLQTLHEQLNRNMDLEAPDSTQPVYSANTAMQGFYGEGSPFPTKNRHPMGKLLLVFALSDPPIRLGFGVGGNVVADSYERHRMESYLDNPDPEQKADALSLPVVPALMRGEDLVEPARWAFYIPAEVGRIAAARLVQS
jgi:hypothetical protein